MKTLKKTGLLVALAASVFIGSSAFTTGGGEELVKITETATVKMQINKVTNAQKVMLGVLLSEKEKVRLSISDNGSEVLLSQVYSKSNGFIQLFDFSSLEDGEYTFKVTTDDEVLESSIEVREAKAFLPEFAAYISDVADDKVTFSYFAPQEDVYLVLKNDEGTTLYEKKVGSGYNNSGIANLSKLDKGTYTLQIKNGDNIESKDITLD